MMVTIENYEEYILLFVDDELDETGKKYLLDFIKLHPELTAEFETYKKTKLLPDETLVFADKQKLLKPKAGNKMISFHNWRMYGVAASLVFMILFAAVKWMNTSNTIIKTPVNIAQQLPKNEENVPTVNPSIQPLKTKKISPPVIVKNKKIIETNTVIPSHKQKPIKKENDLASINSASLKPIHTVPQDLLVLEEPIKIENATTTINNENATEKKLKHKKSFLAWLPVSREKKEGLKHLKENIEEKVAEVKSINESIKNTEFTLKLGNKELLVINR